MRVGYLIALIVSVVLIVALARSQARTPGQLARVVIGPPNDGQLTALLGAVQQWQQGYRRVDAVIHADHTFSSVPDTKLHQIFADLSANHLTLELEAGAVKEWSAEGVHTFAIESPIWERLLRLGAPLTSIAMDEPLIASRVMLHKPDTFAVEQTAQFVALVRRNFPNLLVGDIEPYPAISLVDQLRWLDALNARLKSLGVRGLDFYRIDPDWNAFPSQRGSWHDVATLANACRGRGVRFSLIYWASPAPAEVKSGTANRDTWHEELLAEAAGFKAAGGRADQIVVESWIGLPDRALPDRDPATFAGSLEALLATLKVPASQ